MSVVQCSGPGTARTVPDLDDNLVGGAAVADRICSVEGCDSPARHHRTMCGMHSRRLWKYGTTDEPPARPPRPTTCSIDGCDKPYLAKGLCGAHYARNAKGRLDPDVPVRPQGLPLEERFWMAVDATAGPDACWPWTGSRNLNRGGYGFLTVWENNRHQVVLAHRLSWELANGRPVPDGLFILHSCDNPPCVNPAHLRAGTHLENMADAVRRGRTNPQRGEASVKAKLTTAAVLDIRRRRAAGESREVLAAEYGIHREYVTSLVSRKRWKHI